MGVLFSFSHLQSSSKVASPPLESIKLNFNRSFINPPTVGGFIIKDWTCKLIKAGASTDGAYCGDTSILVITVRPLHEGLELVIQARFNNIFIESDNKTVIEVLKWKILVPWQISNIVKHFHIWQDQGIQSFINHILEK